MVGLSSAAFAFTPESFGARGSVRLPLLGSNVPLLPMALLTFSGLNAIYISVGPVSGYP